MENFTERRKIEHILIAVKENVEFPNKSSFFEYIELIHNPVPELDLEKVDTGTKMFGYDLSAPIIISGMTGGTLLAKKINKCIAEAAEELRVAMGVGSQRAALENSDLRDTFSIVRDTAPDIPIIGNIGASQVVYGLSKDDIEELVDMVKADAIAIHLNPLQESVQPEGEPHYSGLIESIKRVVELCPVPVIVKETGAGFSREATKLLVETGIAGIDVGGAGGTSFAVIEAIRASRMGLEDLEKIAMTFADWGIPTAASILEVRSVAPDIILIATGGIRNGSDIAKAIRIGADYAGVALPVIREAYSGDVEDVKRLITRFIREFRVSMFLVGAKDIGELKEKPVVILGKLREWIEERQLDFS